MKLTELTEYDIIQNHVVGAHAIIEFVHYYQKYHKDNRGPALPLVFPVLPVVFNEDLKKNISTKQFEEGSLFRTINENRALYVGLQERMEAMASQTLKALSFAFSSQMLIYDRTSAILYATKTPPSSVAQGYRDYNEIIHSARRLGAWFSKLTTEEIIAYFNITF